jgi:hypothetical protein
VRTALGVDQRDANREGRLHPRVDVDARGRGDSHLSHRGTTAEQSGLGRWNGRFVLIGYLTSIADCLVASLGIWIFVSGGFPNTGVVRQSALGAVAAAVAVIFWARRRDVTAPVDNSSAPAR